MVLGHGLDGLPVFQLADHRFHLHGDPRDALEAQVLIQALLQLPVELLNLAVEGIHVAMEGDDGPGDLVGLHRQGAAVSSWSLSNQRLKAGIQARAGASGPRAMRWVS
jgi:hypothetical protein